MFCNAFTNNMLNHKHTSKCFIQIHHILTTPQTSTNIFTLRKVVKTQIYTMQNHLPGNSMAKMLISSD